MSPELVGVDLEEPVALTLDGRDAVAWWWRLASRGDWSLPGWRRRRVTPDVRLRLDGDDTTFKRDWPAALEGATTRPAVGEVALFDTAPARTRGGWDRPDRPA